MTSSPITRDLVVVGTPNPVPARQATSPFTIDTTGPNPETDKMIAIFGGVNRTGRWRVRKNIQAFALFGGMDLDLRDAIFEGPVIEISGFWCFGDWTSRCRKESRYSTRLLESSVAPTSATLETQRRARRACVIKGVALFGGVSVRGPKSSRKRK